MRMKCNAMFITQVISWDEWVELPSESVLITSAADAQFWGLRRRDIRDPGFDLWCKLPKTWVIT